MNIVVAIPLFILTGLVVGFPSALADHPTAIVENAPGSSVEGCEVTNECFIPNIVTIDAGGKVTWTNSDNAAHTTTSGTPQDGPDGFFDSSLVLPGNDFTVKFDDIGEYQYFCLVHPWMSGMVIVKEAMADGDGMMDDDSMMMEDDSMMMTAKDASVMSMLSDGTNVMIMTTGVISGEPVRIDIVFEDSEHVNYDIMVMQGDAVVLDETGAHEHQGMGQHMTDMLPTDDPIEITIIFQGYGVDQITGPVNEELMFVRDASHISATISYVEHDMDRWEFDIIVANPGPDAIYANIVSLSTRSDIYDTECRFEKVIGPGKSRTLTGCFTIDPSEDLMDISIVYWTDTSAARQAVIPFTYNGCDLDSDYIHCLPVQEVVSATALVTVSTDMDSYSEGDTISITGSVLQRHTGAISVIVISPSDDIVNIGQPIVGVGNTFQMDIMTDSFMTESGTYTVEAHYSLDQRLPRMASTTFMYTATQDITEIIVPSYDTVMNTDGLVGATYSWSNNTLALHFAEPIGFVDVSRVRVMDDRCAIEFSITQYITRRADQHTILINTTASQRESLASMHVPSAYLLDEEFDVTQQYDVVPLDVTGSRPYGMHSCVITYGSNEYLLDVYTPDTQTYRDAVHAAFKSWSDLNPELKFVWVEYNPTIYIEWTEYTAGHLGLACIHCLGFGATMDVSTYRYDCDGARISLTPDTVQDTIMHELGHILGLGHHTDRTHLMYGNDTYAQDPFDTLGYTIPYGMPDSFVGEAELIREIELLEELINDMEDELDRLYAIHENNGSRISYDKYSAYYEQYDRKFHQYKTLYDRWGCMHDPNPPSSYSPN